MLLLPGDAAFRLCGSTPLWYTAMEVIAVGNAFLLFVVASIISYGIKKLLYGAIDSRKERTSTAVPRPYQAPARPQAAMNKQPPVPAPAGKPPRNPYYDASVEPWLLPPEKDPWEQ